MLALTAIECFIAIIAIYILIYWLTPRKHSWVPMLVVVVLLAVLAYHVVPNDTDDLNRYYTQIDYMRELGYDYLQKCFDQHLYEWDTYRVCAYYFYFISKLSSDNWLPAITIFIVYGLMMLIMYKAANRFNINKGYLFLGTMFFLATYWYYDTYSGIRNGLAFAIILACAYYHLVERKHIPICFIGYLCACLIHGAGVILVVLVLLTVITLNNSGKFLNFLLIFGLTVGGAGIKLLAEYTDIVFFQSIAGRVDRNLASGSLYTQTLYLVNISIFVFVSIILIYVSYYLTNGEYSHDLKRLYKFTSIIIYFLVGSILSELIFMRITRWILPVLGGLIFMIGMQMQSNQIQKEGMTFYKYFAPAKEAVRVKTKSIIIFLFVVYTSIHLWYLINGSSLTWLHFD